MDSEYSVRRACKPGREKAECNREKIVCYMTDGTTESVYWSDRDEIRMIKTGEGPWSEDVYWPFTDKEESDSCAIPMV